MDEPETVRERVTANLRRELRRGRSLQGEAMKQYRPAKRELLKER